MVRGLELFKSHFKGYEDRYVLIGGTACSLAMDEAGLDFRLTKDLDIVLCVEALDESFVHTFWDFIHKGDYNNQQKSTEKRLLYRFYDPKDTAYPWMLELFSRKPDALTLGDDSHLEPIPMDEEISSLSAILMDDVYYHFVHAGKREIDRMPVAGTEILIPLKARAWLDLTERKNLGQEVDSRRIRIHRNDIFKLYQLMALDASVPLPDEIRKDLLQFLAAMETENNVDLKSLGLRNTDLQKVLDDMRHIYGCDH